MNSMQRLKIYLIFKINFNLYGVKHCFGRIKNCASCMYFLIQDNTLLVLLIKVIEKDNYIIILINCSECIGLNVK